MARQCQLMGCPNAVPESKGTGARFCSEEHAKTDARERSRAYRAEVRAGKRRCGKCGHRGRPVEGLDGPTV